MDFGTILNSDWAETTETLQDKGGNSDWETLARSGVRNKRTEAENS